DRVGEFLQAGPYGGTGQPCRLGHLADPAASDGAGFHRSPEAACAFIQERAQDGKLRCNSLCDGVLHGAKHTTLIGEMAKLFWRASLAKNPSLRRAWHARFVAQRFGVR